MKLGLVDDLKGLSPLDLAGAKKLAVLSGEYASSAQAVAFMKRRCASMPEVTETKKFPAKAKMVGLEQVVHSHHTHAGESS